MKEPEFERMPDINLAELAKKMEQDLKDAQAAAYRLVQRFEEEEDDGDE